LDTEVSAVDREEVTDARPTAQELLRDMAGLQSQLARVIRDRDLAADILQDAVVTALQKLRDGEISGHAQLDGYVYRVALNHFRNHLRKDKSRVSEHNAEIDLIDAGEREPPESLQAAQWAKVVKRMLTEVKPARDRELLVRFYLYEETKEQLCQSLGLSDLHFNRVIFRARERFRELLERRGLGKADFLSMAVVFLAP
jgi:RNA polymerase sigma-70 factor (ECF subfamily)